MQRDSGLEYKWSFGNITDISGVVFWVACHIWEWHCCVICQTCGFELLWWDILQFSEQMSNLSGKKTHRYIPVTHTKNEFVPSLQKLDNVRNLLHDPYNYFYRTGWQILWETVNLLIRKHQYKLMAMGDIYAAFSIILIENTKISTSKVARWHISIQFIPVLWK